MSTERQSNASSAPAQGKLIERLREEMIIIIQKPFGCLLLMLIVFLCCSADDDRVADVVGPWKAQELLPGHLLVPINLIKRIIASGE